MEESLSHAFGGATYGPHHSFSREFQRRPEDISKPRAGIIDNIAQGIPAREEVNKHIARHFANEGPETFSCILSSLCCCTADRHL
ncbi:MAG: hypothetical protein Q8P12_04620 [bacterium]|nr:hypothetical protein [bacterium]